MDERIPGFAQMLKCRPEFELFFRVTDEFAQEVIELLLD